MSRVDVASDIAAVESLCSAPEKIKGEIAKVIIGQEKVIEQLSIALLSSGHCLLVGVPGLAKTGGGCIRSIQIGFLR